MAWAPSGLDSSQGKVDGKDVYLITLKAPNLEVDVCTLGAALVAVRLKVADEWLDVVLGYESLERYTNGGKPNFGTAVGRCANRVAGGTFEIDGQSFQLDKNNGEHSLHGGTDGYYKQVFDVASVIETELVLTLKDQDGSMGYPGSVGVTVAYSLQENELHFKYSGTCDKPTLLSMTNHAYWNLKGHQAGDVLDHKLMVSGSKTTATDETLKITGELRDVAGTHLDMRGSPQLLRDVVDKGGPVDVNYCLDEAGGWPAASLVGPNGVTMEVWTDQPGLQVFTGANIANSGPGTWWNGKGADWQKFGAVCLEPQLWPDGIHHSHFPSPILRPGETYNHHSWHRFIVLPKGGSL